MGEIDLETTVDRELERKKNGTCFLEKEKTDWKKLQFMKNKCVCTK
jgi:hypothetical protein